MDSRARGRVVALLRRVTRDAPSSRASPATAPASVRREATLRLRRRRRTGGQGGRTYKAPPPPPPAPASGSGSGRGGHLSSTAPPRQNGAAVGNSSGSSGRGASREAGRRNRRRVSRPAVSARHLLRGLLLGATCLTGCSEGAGPQNFTGGIAGQVFDIESRASADARIFLLDPTGTPPPRHDQRCGRALPPLRHLPGRLLHRGLGRRSVAILFDSPGAALHVSAGRALPHDIRVGRYPYFREPAPAVRGIVRDATDGRPIARAYVSVGDTDLAALFAGVAEFPGRR